MTDDPLQNYNERLAHHPRPIVQGSGAMGIEGSSISSTSQLTCYGQVIIVSISAYSTSSEHPGTTRQIVALGIAFAVVVVGLIAFNLTLERVSLLDDLKKDVQSLALVHRNYADRELREYGGLLEALADRVRHGDHLGDLIRQRQSYDPALIEGRVLGPCAMAPGTGCPSAIARTPGGPASGLLMDTVPGTVAGKRIMIARQIVPVLDPALDPTGTEPRHEAGGRMIALTLDLDRMVQGLQEVTGALDTTVSLPSTAPRMTMRRPVQVSATAMSPQLCGSPPCR